MRTRNANSISISTHKSAKPLLTIVVLLLLLPLPLSSIPKVHADSYSSAAIYTDQQQYIAGDNATIFGSGFLANSTIDVSVLQPDNTTVNMSALSDGNGNFTTVYQVPGLNGNYTVTATDGINTANTTFNDPIPFKNPTVSPTAVTILQGSSATYTVTVDRNVPLVSFTVDLSVVQSTLPNGVSVSFSPSSSLSFSSGIATKSSTLTLSSGSITPVGSYTFKVEAALHSHPIDNGLSNLLTLAIVPHPAVTSQGLCSFDTDTTLTGNQFNLIYIQASSSTFTLRGSNPGQFAYNVFTGGVPGSQVSLTLSIPYPFVTQGSNPIQVNDGVGQPSAGCFSLTGNDITSQFSITGTSTITPSGAPGIGLSDYGSSPTVGTSAVTLTINGNLPASGIVFVTIHLDYGLKGNSGYGKGASSNAINPATSAVLIPNLGSYTFSATGADSSGATYSQAVQNENIFKQDPGFAGLVLDSGSNPIAGATVKIYGSSGNLIGTATTDVNGFYSFQYKTGKSATFTLQAIGISKVATLKANSFVEVDFP